MFYEIKRWACICKVKMIYVFSQKVFKVSLTKSSTSDLSFPSPNDQALKPSKEGWDGFLDEEAKQDV